MQLEDYFDFQAPDDIRLKGSRIGIETILYEYIHQERRPEQIARRYPSLSLEQVYATILYYLHDKDAVGRYLSDWMEYCRRSHEEARKQNPELYEKLRQLAAKQRRAPKKARR